MCTEEGMDVVECDGMGKQGPEAEMFTCDGNITVLKLKTNFRKNN